MTPEGRDALKLPFSMQLATVESLYDNLGALLATPGPVHLDASAVEQIDTSSLQVLVAFAAAVRSADRALTWQSSRALSSAADLLGLSTLLGLEPS